MEKKENKMFHPHEKWSIEKGDYKRDDDATWSYHKKQRRKSMVKTAVWIIIYSLAVSGVTYLALTLF